MSLAALTPDVAWVDTPSNGFIHFSATVYLDARRPEWAALEAAGEIRYHAGLRWVLIRAAHMDVVTAIRAALAEGRA